MSTAADQIYREGFGALLLRRCGRRPWRCTLLLWLALISLVLALGFADFKHERWPDAPPPANAIHYALFMRTGGPSKYTYNRDMRPQIAFLELPDGVDQPPPYDPAAADARFSSQFMVIEPGADGPKLLCHVPTFEGWFGWPWRLAEWRGITNYEVSDPHGPFTPYPARWKNYRLFGLEMVQMGFASPDGARIKGFQIFWPSIVKTLFMTGVLSVLIVGSIRLAYLARQRRRRREGCCLACGYSLKATPHEAPCPECGTSAIP